MQIDGLALFGAIDFHYQRAIKRAATIFRDTPFRSDDASIGGALMAAGRPLCPLTASRRLSAGFAFYRGLLLFLRCRNTFTSKL